MARDPRTRDEGAVMTSRRKMIADYTTIGLALGLPWRIARAIAKQIVADKRSIERGEQ